MAFETFTLKDHELELIKKRSRDGANEFYSNLVSGYEEHGSLTKKQYDAFKSDTTLNAKERELVTRKAATERVKNDGRDFYIRIDDEYDDNGYVSGKLYNIIKRDLAEEANRKKIKGVPVINQKLLDGKPVCYEKGCKSIATEAVGEIGYCGTHAEEKKAEASAATE
jgi:hypothetical protein